jgi:hypothetical protein
MPMPNTKGKLMYKITVAYDENSAHYSKEYSDELNAHEEFAKYIDWGFADEYATINLFTPSGKCYTKIFHRNGKVVKR